MINLRVAAASTVAFAILLLIWSRLAERSYDAITPIIEERQRQAGEQQAKFSRLIREDMAGLGVNVQQPDAPPIHPSEEALSSTAMPARQLRPLGSWMGVCETGTKHLVFMKFEKEKYRLWIKNPNGDDIREKGEYEYLFDSIHFKPEGEDPYTMEYYMVSKNGIQLYQYRRSYNLEREEDIEFDF